MINYAIPGAFEMSNLNFKLLDLKRRFPDYFYLVINIEITYGNPQFCIWDGGRIFTHYRYATKDPKLVGECLYCGYDLTKAKKDQ